MQHLIQRNTRDATCAKLERGLVWFVLQALMLVGDRMQQAECRMSCMRNTFVREHLEFPKLVSSSEAELFTSAYLDGAQPLFPR